MVIQIRTYNKSELFLANVFYANWKGYKLEQWDKESGFWWISFGDNKNRRDLFFFALGNHIIVNEENARLLDQVFKIYDKNLPGPNKILQKEVLGTLREGTESIRAEINSRQLENQFWQGCPIEKVKTSGTIAEWRKDIEIQMMEAFAQAEIQSMTW